MEVYKYPVLLFYLYGFVSGNPRQETNNANASKIVVPINKLCSKGKVLLVNDAATICTKVAYKNWTGFIYSSSTFERIEPNLIEPNYKFYNQSHATCSPDGWDLLTNINPDPNDTTTNFILTETGQLMWRSNKCTCGKCKNWIPLKSEYFVDGLVRPGSEEGADWTGWETDQVIYYCKEQASQNDIEIFNYKRNIDKTFASVLFITAFIYFLTTILYLAIWKSHVLPGRILFSVVLSRTIWSLLLGLAYVGKLYRWDLHSVSACKFIAVTAHYFTISSYTWVTVLTFNLWWTFRSIRPAAGQDIINTKYLQFSLFGWGLPLVLIIISVIADSTLKAPDNPSLLPAYGDGICFVVDCAYGLYIHLFTAIILWPALGFSILTFHTLYKFKKDTARVRNSKHGENQSSFRLYVKLLWLMSVNWVIGHAIWYFHEDYDGSNDYFWRNTALTVLHWGFDLIGSAVFILVVFGCSNANLTKLEQNYQPMHVLFERFRILKTSAFAKSETSKDYGTVSKATETTN